MSKKGSQLTVGRLKDWPKVLVEKLLAVSRAMGRMIVHDKVRLTTRVRVVEGPRNLD